MTNSIISRGLRLLGRTKDPNVVVGDDWAITVVENIDAKRMGRHTDARCPQCEQKPVTCVWEMWENTVTDDDFRHVDYFWCANAHMWITTESYHDQLLAGQWG